MFDELLAELSEGPEAVLDGELRRLEVLAREVEARRLAVLAIAELRQVPATDGHRSTQAYVRATLNQPAAAAIVRRARLVGEFPVLGEALLAGRIGVAQVDQIVRAWNNPRAKQFFTPDAAAQFCEWAEHLPYRDLTICIDRWLLHADPDGTWKEQQETIDNRTAHVSTLGEGVEIAASGGDPLTVESMRNIFKHFVELEFRADVAARREMYGDRADAYPLPRSAAQRRFDALKTIFERAYTSTGDGRMPDPVVNILFDQKSLTEFLANTGITMPAGDAFDPEELDRDQIARLLDELTDDPDSLFNRRIETVSGQTIHPKLLLQALLTGWVRRVVLDARGVPIEMSEKVRLFRGSSRTAATLLHRTCAHPGCLIPADQCQVDHNRSHSEGGRTVQANAQPECGVHNRFKYANGWRIRRADSGRLYNIRGDGTVVLFAGERPPDFTDAEERERLQRRIAGLRRRAA